MSAAIILGSLDNERMNDFISTLNLDNFRPRGIGNKWETYKINTSIGAPQPSTLYYLPSNDRYIVNDLNAARDDIKS